MLKEEVKIQTKATNNGEYACERLEKGGKTLGYNLPRFNVKWLGNQTVPVELIFDNAKSSAYTNTTCNGTGNSAIDGVYVVRNFADDITKYCSKTNDASANVNDVEKGSEFYKNNGFTPWSGFKNGAELSYGSDSIALSYDYAENAVFANRALYASTEYDNKDLALVRRLDDAAMMGPADTIFKGFNGNFAKMQITFSGVYDKEVGANVILMNILDHKLDGAAIKDTESPHAVIPNEYSAGELPRGEKDGLYPFPAIVGYDAVDGIITDKLTYLVVDESGEKVSVDSKKGGFIPEKIGKYTITVGLTDKSGNVAETKTVTAEILPFIEAISLKFDSALKPQIKIGESVTVPGGTK